MGYRVIRLELPSAPARLDLLLLDQAVAFARFNHIEASLEEPERYPGTLELTMDGNSSYLNEITPYFNDSVVQIATDIDPGNESLQSIAACIASQLNAQIVDWSDIPGLVVARKGRELEERIAGESSFEQIGGELDVHANRIRDELTEYRELAGPTAWRRRPELLLKLRIDSISLIVSARRLRRIADDIRHRLPGSHLNKALVEFDGQAPSLVALRNIAEHIDEYSIGHGRNDTEELEPGDVFKLEMGAHDITVSARLARLDVLSTYEACRSLIECVSAAAEHYAITHAFPPVADFDFVIFTKTGAQIVARGDESPEHAKARAAISAALRPIKLPPKRCPKCNDWL